jgi:hypothetical protein
VNTAETLSDAIDRYYEACGHIPLAESVSAGRIIREWALRHREDRQLHSRLRGHDNYDGLHGNSRSRHRFFARALRCTFTWRNRRGGKRQSCTWEQCTQGLDRSGIARPRITEVKRRGMYA